MRWERPQLGFFIATAAFCVMALAARASAEPAKRASAGTMSEPAPLSDDRSRCLAAHERAQVQRLDRLLLEAKEQLLLCARDACPGPIRLDCTGWLIEVEGALPSVVIAVSSELGDEPSAVVLLDGKPVTQIGRALSLNPGAYRLRVELPPRAPIEQVLILREGERERRILVRFEGSQPPKQPAAASAAPSQAKSEVSPVNVARPMPWLTYALAGVSLAGAMGTAYFGLSALAARDERLLECAPLCNQEEAAAVTRPALLADISLVVAIASGLGAGYAYVSRPGVPLEPSPRSRLSATARKGGALFELGAAF